MAFIRTISLLLLSALPFQAVAAVTANDLPGDAIWYLHADLAQLRNSESGKGIVAWFDAEVGTEVREEVGIDLNAEIDSVTAFSDSMEGAVVVLQGPLSKTMQDKLLAIAVLKANVDTREHRGKTYYFAAEEETTADDDGENYENFDDGAYFSFAVDRKLIAATSEEQLKVMLDNGGEIAGSDSHDGALFVLSADVSFVQAGLRTSSFADESDDGDWESNILRNTEEAAVLIADQGGQIAVEAQLRSKDPKMASSIGGIVNGLISLQAFNTDLPPEVLTLIQNTKVIVEGAVLTINTVIDPELVLTMLNH